MPCVSWFSVWALRNSNTHIAFFMCARKKVERSEINFEMLIFPSWLTTAFIANTIPAKHNSHLTNYLGWGAKFQFIDIFGKRGVKHGLKLTGGNGGDSHLNNNPPFPYIDYTTICLRGNCTIYHMCVAPTFRTQHDQTFRHVRPMLRFGENAVETICTANELLVANGGATYIYEHNHWETDGNQSKKRLGMDK